MNSYSELMNIRVNVFKLSNNLKLKYPDTKEGIDQEEEVDLPPVKEDTFDMIDINSARPTAPPFPELVHVNLSHNQVIQNEVPCNMGNEGSILYNFSFSRVFCNMAGIRMHHVHDVKNALSVNGYKCVRC